MKKLLIVSGLFVLALVGSYVSPAGTALRLEVPAAEAAIKKPTGATCPGGLPPMCVTCGGLTRTGDIACVSACYGGYICLALEPGCGVQLDCTP